MGLILALSPSVMGNYRAEEFGVVVRRQTNQCQPLDPLRSPKFGAESMVMVDDKVSR
jgi:hypothetical protein